MKKKILMISSTWSTSYIYKMLNGMLRRLENDDVKLYVFNAYDEALESEYQLMERAIYSLPDANQFDGVLLAVNSVGNQSTANELARHYRNLGKKVLSLELKFDDVPSIGTDNYRAEYELVEHLIEVHGCRVLNYVGGPEEHMENQERYRAFCDCLKAHGIEPEERRIRHFSFQERDGVDAYLYFKKEGIHLPDAVVCANDGMALGYCSAAAEDGYFAPRDFRIVGFDNLEKGQNYYPSITSVERSWEQRGYDSIEILLEMLQGIEPKAFDSHSLKLKINESCGCHGQERIFHNDFNQSYKQQFKEKQMNAFSRKSRKLLCGSSSISDFQKRLAICQELAGIEEIAIGLNASLLQSSIETKMEYDQEFDIYTNGVHEKRKSNEGLLPECWSDEAKIYFFSPLHFEKINFGYCVIANIGTWHDKLDHRTFMESICLGLEGIRQHANLQRMNQRLEDLYVRDAMTGMYNRFGYESFAKSFYQKQNGNVYVAYFDLDNLKLYNDRFGHEIGDSAICGVSSGIMSSFGEDTVYVRMGGDEFLALGVYEGQEALVRREQQLDAYLKEYSQKKQLPFSVSVSVGYISNENGIHTLEELIWIADHNMYQDKSRKKSKKKEQGEKTSKLISSGFAEIIENIPDRDYNVDDIYNAFRKNVPDITSKYGILYMGASVVEVNMRGMGPENRKEAILYDIRGNEETNDYVIRFETGRGGFASVTTGIRKSEEWTAEMKNDVYILSKMIFLLVGRANAMQALTTITYMDQMTGIGNSRKLNQVMLQYIEKGKFYSCTTNFINIKNMKLLNGRFGETVGDQILSAFANDLQCFIGEQGCVARMGGDNFIVFIESEREKEFLDHMNQLQVSFRDIRGEIRSVKVGTRIGYYEIQPGDMISDALNNSSTAFHFADRENHPSVVSFEEYMKSNVLRIKELEENTPEAIRNHEFVVFYQPKADISDSGNFRLNGGEALIRWKKDDKMILPLEFIPVLERTGLITMTDFYVFEQVCQDINEWKSKGLEPVRISSNFSRRHLKDDKFIDKIEAIIEKYKVEPEYLEIEITESYDLEDMEILKKFEQRMHKIGIHLSVDDFGSGFSSLKLIKNIVSDTIKLDKSVIDGIGENRGDEVIVQHMVQMIQSLGKEVIAEGVENKAQADFLRENECFNIQGYLFGKPMEKEEFEKLLCR